MGANSRQKALVMTISAAKSGKSTEKNQCFLCLRSSVRLVSDFFGLTENLAAEKPL
jgi:hypothetical protein